MEPKDNRQKCSNCGSTDLEKRSGYRETGSIGIGEDPDGNEIPDFDTKDAIDFELKGVSWMECRDCLQIQ